ncbi:MAG: hypothetical protein KDC33_01400 [Thermoleophilia bacterium]|nr:hypothetical protein [Thermoleophilia bacterium]
MGIVKKALVLGGLGWAYSKMPRDPREWPAFLGEQFALVKDQARESVEAGKRASARREQQLEAEVQAAMGDTAPHTPLAPPSSPARPAPGPPAP